MTPEEWIQADPQLWAAFTALRASTRRRFFGTHDTATLDLLRRVYMRVFGKVRPADWFGMTPRQTPSDLALYAEAWTATRPRVIVETGTAEGYAAVFYAEVLRRIHGDGNFRVITIDCATDARAACVAADPSIIALVGDSASAEMRDQVRCLIPDGWSVCVTLDSEHGAEHVLTELQRFAPMVSPGQYLIVQDTYLGLYWGGNLTGEQQEAVLAGQGGNLRFDYIGSPLGAVEAFLEVRPEFQIDYEKQRWVLTQHPFGWLKRQP